MNQYQKLSLSLVLVISVLFPTLTLKAASSDVWLVPSSSAVGSEQGFNVEIHLASAVPLGVFNLSLDFDKTQLMLNTNTGNNGFVAGSDTGNYTLMSNAESTAGHYLLSGLCAQNCASGSDIDIATVYLKTLPTFISGSSQVNVTLTELGDNLGTKINIGNVVGTTINSISQDTSAPVRTKLLPSGLLSAGTTGATLSLVTNEMASCKFGTNPGIAFGAMAGTFTTTGGIYHSSNISSLLPGTSYKYYVRCKDEAGNINADDLMISFNVASAVASSGGGGGASASAFANSIVGIGNAWEYGTDEQWHLKLAGANSEFKMGEKVQFFAQVGPIKVDHQWSLRLYKDNVLNREIVNPVFSPDKTFGWNYSNFVPYELNLAAGAYRAEYWLEIGGVKNEVGRASFNVRLPDNIYIFDHATTSLWWENGAGDEYWNLKPLGETSIFSVGDTVHLMVQVRDIYKDHRYKTALYRGTTMLWDYEADWLKVGAGWDYSNFYPYYEKAQPGNYKFKTYIDIGNGFTELANTNFTVEGVIADYEYRHSYAAKGWKYGAGDEYWNLSATDISDQFVSGDTIYAVSQIKNVYVDHQWKVELYKSGEKLWAYEAPKNIVGSGWSYSNFTPTYANAVPGEFEFKIYLATGGTYKLFDSLKFRVTRNTANYQYLGLTIAKDWKYGVDGEYYNLVPVGVSKTYAKGDTVYAISKLKEVSVNHKWKVELYKYGQLLWTNETDTLNVGAGWAYDVYKPYLENAEIGNYEFKIYLDEGSGYKFLDSDTFSVK